MQTINLEEILKKHFSNNLEKHPDYLYAAMREAVEQALELAAENAKLKVYTEYTFNEPKYYVDKDSITNTINLVK